MIRGILFSVILLITITGCGRQPYNAKYVLDGMNRNQTYVANEQIKLLEMGQQEIFMHSANPDMKITVSFGNLEGNTIGQADLDGDDCQITLDPDLDPTQFTDPVMIYFTQREFSVTLAHEIGHCFGLSHSAGRNEVMSAYYSFEAGEIDSFTRFHVALRSQRIGN